ncbi:UTP--glucose-1-phosphate uridylyltransferase GalU [bacterium]|nr:UTP--glucose-1-phosphate uridylyltransferase GalU [bacterium]
MKVRKAVIPVAGLGTRFLPATKSVAKEMLPIVDRPTIHYIVEEAAQAGIENIIFVTASGKHAIEDYFDRSVELEIALEKKGDEGRLKLIKDISEMVQVNSVRQKTPLGLGHAVLCAKDLVGNEPFVVLLGDDMVRAEVPATRQLADAYEKTQRAVLGTFRVPDEDTHLYGIVDIESSDGRLHKVAGMVEKPSENSPSNLAIIGRYVLPPEIFECIERTPRGKGNEIQLTDALNILNEAEGQGVYAYELEGERFDAGNIIGFLEANIGYALEREELAGPLKDILKKYLARE